MAEKPCTDTELKHLVIQLAAKVDTLNQVASAPAPGGAPPASATPSKAAPAEEDDDGCSCAIKSATTAGWLVPLQVLLCVLLIVILGLVGANLTASKQTLNTVNDADGFAHVMEGEHHTVTEEILASTHSSLFTSNTCADAGPGWSNIDCLSAVADEIEQAGANVTKGFVGDIDNSATPPITDAYYKHGLCPVNVHWHLGTEHLSVGEYDEHGTGPYDDYAISDDDHGDDHRRLAEGGVRVGYQCHHYDKYDPKFTTEYEWKHCVDMMVGQTYEIHWPHSIVGACGTPYQYQTPFYDGVFCNFPWENAADVVVQQSVGVQSQSFVVVNDEDYYYPDLIKGMIVAGDFGSDMAIYTGSTTGTSRDNDICSAYSPITWQVDRKCHMISASSFDKLCADMKSQVDDMSEDLYAHGSRKLVAKELSSTQETRK